MRKSEHTELATLSRLAVLASNEGLVGLTYGSASTAAHLSKGAIQRLFIDKMSLQQGVFLHAVKLMQAHVFDSAPVTHDSAPAKTGAQILQNTLTRWADWISGDAGLPGGCVLLASLATRGFSAEMCALIALARTTLLAQFSAAAARANLISNNDELSFEQVLLGRALVLHIAQFPQAARRAENKSAFVQAVIANPLGSHPVGIRPRTQSTSG